MANEQDHLKGSGHVFVNQCLREFFLNYNGWTKLAKGTSGREQTKFQFRDRKSYYEKMWMAIEKAKQQHYKTGLDVEPFKAKERVKTKKPGDVILRQISSKQG